MVKKSKLRAGLGVSVLALALIAGATLVPSSPARADGLTRCTVSKIGTSFNRSWRYLITLAVPKEHRCRVYVWNDSKTGGWQYCWNTSENVVAKKCGDLVNNESFTGWRARAVCSLKTSIKTFTQRCSIGH